MEKQVIMQDPKIYEQLGELTGRFNTFEKNMADQFSELKQVIRDQNNVPYPIFEKHVLDTKQEIKDLTTRVEGIEDALKIKEATITGKLAQFLDSAIVKIIGGAAIAALMLGMYLSYKTQIDTISEKVDNVDKQEKIIEQKE